MRTAVDTNVISAIWSREPLAHLAAEKLGQARGEGGLVISAPVFAELFAHPGATPEFVDGFIAASGIQVDFALTEAVWRETARSYAEYALRRRKSGGDAPKRLLVDFLIGAHASLHADRLFTLDRARYTLAFPRLITVDW